MNLKLLSNDVLLNRTTRLAETERRVTTQVLLCLLEIERRRLFAELGFSSLFDYCVRGLKYSESAACRRISATRLLRDVPMIEEQIQSGELSLSTACQVQSFCTSAKRQQNKSFTPEEKAALIHEVKSKSARDCEKLLADKVAQVIPAEKVRAITVNQTEIRFVADNDLMKSLTRIQELCAHKLGGASDYGTLFKMMAEIVLNKVDPTRRKVRGQRSTSEVTNVPDVIEEKTTSDSEVNRSEIKIAAKPTISAPTASRSRYIPAKIRQEVWRRDQGKCTFVHPETNRRCQARYGLELDHVQPFALGGDSTTDNLRLCCHQHNAFYATRVFGEQHMAQFVDGR